MAVSPKGDDSPRKGRSLVDEFFPWVSTMLSENCASRLQGIVGFQRPQASRRRPLTRPTSPDKRMPTQQRAFGQINDSAKPQIRATPSGDLPVDFFKEIARKAVNDPFIESQLDVDHVAPMLWAKPKTMRLLFLQMCIRDCYDLCRDVWWQLEEGDRRTYRDVYHGYVPPGFFEGVASDTDDMHLYDDVSENFSETRECTREGTMEPAQSKECSWGTYSREASVQGSWCPNSRENTLDRLKQAAGTLTRLHAVPRPFTSGSAGRESRSALPREWTGRSNLDLDRERTALSEW